MADPATRIVSLTITEGGYNINDVTGSSTPTTRPSWPTSSPGAAPARCSGCVTEALARRRAARHPAVHGDVLRQHPGQRRRRARRVHRLRPAARTRTLGEWMRERGARSRTAWSTGSPRSPPTTDRAALAERFGVEDAWPVVCEPFTQWVLEDDFAGGRPPFEDVGVQIVADVEPYELMKLRLLNASHQALCYFGYLAGYRLRARGRARTRCSSSSCSATWTREATPTLPPVPGVDLDALQARADRAVRQPPGARHPRPAVRRELRPHPEVAAAGDPRATWPPAREIDRSARSWPSWARYAEGVDEQGEPIDVVDRLRDKLMARRRSAARGPAGVRPRPGALRRPGRRRAVRHAVRGRPPVAPRDRRPRHSRSDQTRP